jgi:hypothetical protein
VFDTAMFILFCAAVPVVAYVLIRLEKGGAGAQKGPWRPTPPKRPDSDGPQGS